MTVSPGLRTAADAHGHGLLALVEVRAAADGAACEPVLDVLFEEADLVDGA